jgi:hypothetical protein
MDDPAERRLDDTNSRSVQHIDAAIATVERVIESNLALAGRPGHAGSARQRIAEGKQELAALRAERDALEAGDIEQALKIAEDVRERRSVT